MDKLDLIQIIRNENLIIPEEALPKIRALQEILPESGLSNDIINLRKNKYKPFLEKWIMCLFCFGLGNYYKMNIVFYGKEASDYDAICLFNGKYIPVQIKEIVPKYINKNTDLFLEISKLENKYPRSPDLSIIIKLNRTISLSENDIKKIKDKCFKINIASLWILFSISKDQTEWMIIGDLKNGDNKLIQHKFSLPQADSSFISRDITPQP